MYPTNDQQLNFETDNSVYFFIHGLDPLNNWSSHAVKIWSKTFPTAEHAYQYKKFDKTAPDIALQILAAPSPWAAMQIERAHKSHIRSDWHEAKAGIMAEIVRAKVTQNEDVRNCLRATGSKQIVENSPWDDYWGIGKEGAGENTMGKILMQIRDELRASAT